MFGSFSPHNFTSAAASLSTTTHATAPSSPPPGGRPSRLRGLSYLRTYTRDHLHHHSNSGSTPQSESISQTTPQRPIRLSRSNSSPSGPQTQSSDTVPARSFNLQPVPARPFPSRSTTNPVTDPLNSGWLPTVGGQDSLSRVAPEPQPTSAETSTDDPLATMTRRRAATAVDDADPSSSPHPSLMRGTTSPAPDTATAAEPAPARKDMPTLRLIPHHEPRSARPSLTFPIVTRTLSTNTTKVRVGRFSERDSGAADALTNPFSTAPVGFKSKVVSRRHCELWCEGAQWYIKDVKSSSGTFLNHVRLSSPGVESRAYPVNDGDIVQLGIDFKGGEEQIFRCVKIRVECNRGWQKSLNQFNTSTHKRLLNRAQGGAAKDSDAQSTHSSECSICLCPVAPCQALFVAPCSHVWHYKCIRTLIYPSWPSFQCPNCRAYADLEAEVDQPEEEEDDDEIDEEEEEEEEQGEDLEDVTKQSTEASNSTHLGNGTAGSEDEDLTEMMHGVSVRDPPGLDENSVEPSSSSGSDAEAEAGPSESSTSSPVAIVASTNAPINTTLPESIMARSATPTSHTQFALAAGVLGDIGPTTPMNDSGPFIFDGASSARRSRPVDDMAREPVREEIEGESGVGS